jgi:hypothetical protein
LISNAIFSDGRHLVGDAAHALLRRDDSDFLVFFFSKPEDAKAFAEPFGGKRLPSAR